MMFFSSALWKSLCIKILQELETLSFMQQVDDEIVRANVRLSLSFSSLFLHTDSERRIHTVVAELIRPFIFFRREDTLG